jgi:hypothetical protein
MMTQHYTTSGQSRKRKTRKSYKRYTDQSHDINKNPAPTNMSFRTSSQQQDRTEKQENKRRKLKKQEKRTVNRHQLKIQENRKHHQ